jgi:GT2 family glycosyltransferase
MAKNEWGCFGVKFPSRNFFMFTNRVISNHRAFCRQLPFGDQGIFIDRNLFFETGMFPEIPVMEDYEFSRRLRRYGFRPGVTARRITSSPRRYGEGTRSILKTEISMWYLRYLYRKGCSMEKLKEKYMDIR